MNTKTQDKYNPIVSLKIKYTIVGCFQLGKKLFVMIPWYLSITLLGLTIIACSSGLGPGPSDSEVKELVINAELGDINQDLYQDSKVTYAHCEASSTEHKYECITTLRVKANKKDLVFTNRWYFVESNEQWHADRPFPVSRKEAEIAEAS